MALKRVAPGEDLEISARDYNLIVDAVNDWHSRRQDGFGRTASAEFAQSGVILVRNDSGASRGRFSVLGIDDSILDPAHALPAFQSRVALSGILPDEEEHVGRWVVTLEPLAAGAIGRAVASGIVAARVNVLDVNAQFAEIEDGNATRLQAATSGTAQIVWRQSGAGTKWAVIRIGAGGGSSSSTYEGYLDGTLSAATQWVSANTAATAEMTIYVAGVATADKLTVHNRDVTRSGSAGTWLVVTRIGDEFRPIEWGCRADE